jgi:TRAP-type C4-dicarboxylate transport system permease small subunit
MKAIEKIFSKTASYMNTISAAGIFIIMFISVGNILLRAIFNSPILGTMEIVQYVMLLVVSLALADNELADGNVMVSFILEKMKPKAANILSIITTIVGIALIGFVTYNQYTMILAKYANNAATSVMMWPHWVLVLILTVGFFTLTLALILKLIKLFERHNTLPNHRLTAEELLSQTENPSGNNF